MGSLEHSIGIRHLCAQFFQCCCVDKDLLAYQTPQICLRNREKKHIFIAIRNRHIDIKSDSCTSSSTAPKTKYWYCYQVHRSLLYWSAISRFATSGSVINSYPLTALYRYLWGNKRRFIPNNIYPSHFRIKRINLKSIDAEIK